MLHDNRRSAFEILDLSQTNITNTSYAQRFRDAAHWGKSEPKRGVKQKRTPTELAKLAIQVGFSEKNTGLIVVR